MEGEYRQYPYRFVIVALFSIPLFINGACWVTLSTVLKKAAQTYNVSESLVSLVSLLYLIMYIFVNFPCNWILDVKGIRKGIIVGAVLTALGSGIRCFINVGFAYVLIGQAFCAIAQPFLMNAPAKVATYWFKQSNRPVWTAALVGINIIGSGVGFVMPSAFVDENADIETAKDQFFNLMMVQFSISVAGALLVIFLFRDAPPTPPSYAADVNKMSFGKSFKMLFKNKNFRYLLLAFSMCNGTFNLLGVLMDLIVKPFNYTDNQTSIFGGTMIGVGLVSACLLSLYVERVGKYKGVFVVCSIIAVASTFGFVFCLYYVDSYYLLVGFTVLLGGSMTPLIPLSMDFGCEIVFPVGQAQVSGILMTGGQIVGILQVVIIQNAYGLNDSRERSFTAGLVVASLLLVGSLGYMLTEEKLLRRQKQKLAVQSKESLIL